MTTHTTSKRRFLAGAGAVGASALAGCTGILGGGGNSGGKEVHFITEESAPDAKQFIREAARKFTEETGISVVTEFTGLGTSFDQRIATLVRTGNAPELALAPGYLATTWVQNDLAAPMTDVRETVESEWNADYLGNTRLQIQGEDYLAPLHMNVSCNTYRTDLFEEAGVSPPKTWEEELQAYQTLDESLPEDMAVGNWSFNTGLVGTASCHHRLATNDVEPYQNTGGDPFTGFEVTLDQGKNRERAIEALEHCRELAKYSVNSRVGPSAWASNYFTGKCAVGEFGGPRPLTGAYRENQDLADNSLLNPLPRNSSDDDPEYFTFLEGFAVLKNSNYPDAGKQFAEYLLTGDTVFGMLLNLAPLHNTPVLDAWLDDERYRNSEYMNQNNVPDSVFETLKNDLVPNALPRSKETDPPNPYAGSIQSTFALGEMANQVALQGADPGPAVDEAAQKLRDQFEQLQSE